MVRLGEDAVRGLKNEKQHDGEIFIVFKELFVHQNLRQSNHMPLTDDGYEGPFYYRDCPAGSPRQG